MKLLGIAIIFFVLSSIGFFAGEKHISVLKGIGRAENLIGNIIIGMQNERMTLFEIFESAVVSGDSKTESFIKNLNLHSLNSASKIAEQCGFCNDSTASSILADAFSVLGKYSAKEQIEELSFCRNKLRLLYEKSEDAIKNKAKLLRYSGVFAGIFAVIILL